MFPACCSGRTIKLSQALFSSPQFPAAPVYRGGCSFEDKRMSGAYNIQNPFLTLREKTPMFIHKFFPLAPLFEQHLYREKTQEHNLSLTRYAGFMLFVYDLLDWFEKNPGLVEVKLTCVALAEVQKTPLAIRLRHHFAMNAAVPTIGQLVKDVDKYAFDRLPWPCMGNGSITILRESPEVAAYFRIPATNYEDYEALVFKVAQKIDLAFEAVSVIHDLGLQTHELTSS